MRMISVSALSNFILLSRSLLTSEQALCSRHTPEEQMMTLVLSSEHCKPAQLTIISKGLPNYPFGCNFEQPLA